MKTGIDVANNNGNTCCFAKFFLLAERVACLQNSFNNNSNGSYITFIIIYVYIIFETHNRCLKLIISALKFRKISIFMCVVACKLSLKISGTRAIPLSFLQDRIKEDR